MVKVDGISHIGIAVSNLDKAVNKYKAILGVDEVEQIELPSEGVKIAMLRLGNTEFELLSPIGESGAIARFIKERGEGMHHVAVRVPDVSKAIEDAKAMGFRLVDEAPRAGARGAEAAFVHPKSLHGVLLEFYNR